jgi:hypothetical protein
MEKVCYIYHKGNCLRLAIEEFGTLWRCDVSTEGIWQQHVARLRCRKCYYPTLEKAVEEFKFQCIRYKLFD